MVSHNIGLCQELLGYFSLFLIQFCKEGRLSGKKDGRRCRQPEMVWAGVGKCSARRRRIATEGQVTLPSRGTPQCVVPTMTLGSWTGHLFWGVEVVPLGFPGGSDGKESACNAGDLDSIPGLGRSPGEGNAYPPQYSCLDNSMDRGAWWATAREITKSWT